MEKANIIFNQKMKYFSCAILLLTLFLSCNKSNNNQGEIDDQLIKNYLITKGLNATKDISGIYYIMNLAGTGSSAISSSTIEVKYKGSLLNGTVFDQTASDKTFISPLSKLIPGWQIGIPLMKKGGKATFFIPSLLGYGSTNLGIIPSNSVLIFEIELVDVK